MKTRKYKMKYTLDRINDRLDTGKKRFVKLKAWKQKLLKIKPKKGIGVNLQQSENGQMDFSKERRVRKMTARNND